MDLSDRFLSKTNRVGDCLEWQARKNRHGYGTFKMGGKSWLAHRASWLILKGQDPKDLKVLHKCDNPACVDPDHLFLGTQAENVVDMVSKDRHIKGEAVENSKLVEADVAEIRRLARVGWRQKDIAEEFGVSRPCISRLLSGKTWKHVT